MADKIKDSHALILLPSSGKEELPETNICPLLSMKSGEPRFIMCLRERCRFWHETENQCSLLTIAKALNTIRMFVEQGTIRVEVVK